MRRFMHFSVWNVAAATVGIALFASGTAHADHAPTWVIPGNPWVPVIIDGVDASGAVVEGDWGLSRPGHIPVTVYGGRPVIYELPPRPGYFPSAGQPPRVGRDEVIPKRRRAMPAESFHREWTTDGGSPPAPADVSPVPAYPPPIVEAFPDQKHPRWRRHHGHR